MGRHGDQRPDGDHPGPSNACHKHPVLTHEIRRRLSQRGLQRQPLLHPLHRWLANDRGLQFNEAWAEALKAGEILVARRLIDLALLPEGRLHGGDSDTARSANAITAPLANPLIDKEPSRRINHLPPLAPAALLGGAYLLEDKDCHTVQVTQVFLNLFEKLATADPYIGGKDPWSVWLNPAGILRDGMFHKMDEADWDAVVAVHLRGAFNISRALVGLFREQGSGSFVHFTSTSGLIGNIGQANYAAAKMGVVGLSRILAMEGAAKGVRSNVIAPFAWTRMIASIPVTDEASAKRVERMRTGMRADQVAQLAVALAADGASDVNGQIFAVRGDEVILFNQPRPVRSVASADGWSPERLVREALPALRPAFTDLGASASVFAYDPI